MPESLEPPEPAELSELAGTLKEANEKPANEHSGQSLVAVSLVISILTILSTFLLIFAHRVQSQADESKTRGDNQWQEYQEHRIDARQFAVSLDLLEFLAPSDPAANRARREQYRARLDRLAEEEAKDRESAHESEVENQSAESKINRIAFGQSLLQIGVPLSSITLYTRRRIFFFTGIAFGVLGFLAASLGSFLIR